MMKLATLLILVLKVAASAAAPVKIVVFHTNDIHGWIMPREEGEGAQKRSVGGAAALAAVIRKERGPKLVLDAGDWFQGTPEGTLSRGQAMVDVFNAVGYDAVTPGNHDYDLGEKNLQALVAGLKMPVLGANVRKSFDGKRVGYLKPWIVKKVGGVKVGIFGLVTSRMRLWSFSENIAGLEFSREVDAAKEAVAALRALGATVIIAVTHMGFERPDVPVFEGDQTLAAEVEGIDLIVGGHSHTVLKEPFRDPVHGTWIVQAGTTLAAVGRATLEVDPATGKVLHASGRLIELDVDKTGEAPLVKEAVRVHQAAVSKIFDTVVATATVALSRNRDAESALGDWMMDCQRAFAKTDVALQNGGGIRADMAKGPVTLRTLFDIMPFDNRLVKVTMTGKDLRATLDHGVALAKIVQVSGLTVVYSRAAKPGQRLTAVRIGRMDMLEPARLYSVAANDFMVQGGDGYAGFEGAEKVEPTGTLVRDILRGCAERAPEIALPEAGRLIPAGS
ncbi:MAG: bifunctional UDP-sugar hydrolase/5'-nucleotidase [Elusimicrobiota bacterium]